MQIDKFYLGNKNLKGTGVNIEWTPELIQEYKKCAEDIIYFCRNYIKIIHIDRGKIDLDLYPHQEKAIKMMNDSRRCILLQGRQSGKTTTAVGFITHYVTFNEYKSVIIVANKEKTAKGILERIKTAYESLPHWMQSGVVEWNKSSVEFENGCKIITGSTSSSSVRSESGSVIYIDECVTGDTMITIRNVETGEIQTVTILELKDLLGDENDIFSIRSKIISDDPFIKTFDSRYSNKYTNHIKNSGYEVLTEQGFRSFDTLKESITNSTIKITTDSNSLEGTFGHLVKTIDKEFNTLSSLEIGDVLNNGESVKNIEIIDDTKFVYDLTNVKEEESYITNNITSHNCAFVEGWPEFSASVLPVISSGKKSKILMSSTPNGLNFFYELVDGARKGVNGYSIIEVPWYDVPGRDEEWRINALQELNNDEQKFAQEYALDFLGTSNTLVTGATLRRIVLETPISSDKNTKIYENPKKDHIYTLIADVSRGKGLDYSAFTIFDITKVPYTQVAVFRDNLISPSDYASVIHKFAIHYNDAYTMIEVNDIGAQVADYLSDEYELDNLISTESHGRGRRVSSGFGGKADRGIRTTTPVKNLGCNNLKLLLESDKMKIVDHETMYELSTFVRKGNSYAASAGKNDDLAMTLVLFSWLSAQPYFENLNDIDTMKMLREKTEEEIYNDLLPFGFSSVEITNENNSNKEYMYGAVVSNDTSWL